MIIQGSFPGGRPHSTVLLNSGEDYLSIVESARTIQAVMRHPNNIIIQQKMNDFKRDSNNMHSFSQSGYNNIKTYPVNIARLNLNNEGYPLEDDVLQLYESYFDADLSNVMIHEGDSSAEAAGALAFTTGNNIYFAGGRYNTKTPEGLRLLGHELTHVIQQKEGRVKKTNDLVPSVIYDSGLEAEADRIGFYFKKLSQNSPNLLPLLNANTIQMRKEKKKEKIKKVPSMSITFSRKPNSNDETNAVNMIKNIFDNVKKEWISLKHTKSKEKEGQSCKGYSENKGILYVEGSKTYVNEVIKEKKQKIVPLGGRPCGCHTEVFLLNFKSNVKEIFTTLPPCFFCCGYMIVKNYEPDEIRDPLFPKEWICPESNNAFELKEVMWNMGVKGYIFIDLSVNGENRRYFLITKKTLQIDIEEKTKKMNVKEKYVAKNKFKNVNTMITSGKDKIEKTTKKIKKLKKSDIKIIKPETEITSRKRKRTGEK